MALVEVMVVDALGNAVIDGGGNAVTLLQETQVEGGWAEESWWPEGGWATEPWETLGPVHYMETMDLAPSPAFTAGDEAFMFEDGRLDTLVDLSFGELLAGTYVEVEFYSTTASLGFNARFSLMGWAKSGSIKGLWTPEDELP